MKKFNKDLLDNVTILYVEDEQSIREEVAYFFQKHISNFYTANNGIEGIEVFEKVNPDIIITDIQMPKINGLDMLKQLNVKNVPVIITTAYSDVDYFIKAIELNVKKFVTKPIDLYELLFAVQDCVSETHLKNKLFEKENLLTIVDENVLLSITDINGIIIDASHAFCDFIEYSKEELIGKTHQLLKHEDTPKSFYTQMWDEIKDGKVYKTEIKNRKKSGEIYWANLTITPVFKDGKIVNYTAIRQDVTNKKKLELLSIEDDLTKLYNRRYFNKIIDKEIRRVKREENSLSLLSLDIDFFKKYNDTYGHPSGDDVLSKVSQVLKDCTLRSSDYAFRMGGEEFCVIFSGLNIEESFDYANEIISKIEKLQIEHKTSTVSKYITSSAGLVVMNHNILTKPQDLYKYADEALYMAKINGRKQVILSEESK